MLQSKNEKSLKYLAFYVIEVLVTFLFKKIRITSATIPWENY